MKWFKRKPKIVRHELKAVGYLPVQTHFYRAVECKHCGKQFIMDVFGGWAIEWKYRELKETESLNKDDLMPAIETIHKTPIREWTQLGYNDVCTRV